MIYQRTDDLISIIIPVHNGGDNFKTCLQSLSSSLPNITDIPTEVIVVIDGCTDDSLQLAKQFGATVVEIPICGGPAKARNMGAQKAQGDILFFIDADVTLHPNTVSQVFQLFQQNPTMDAVIGSYDDAPGATNFLSQYKNLFHHYTHQTSQDNASTFWGACGAIKRNVFLAVGGFDEQFTKPSVEDIELGYRLKESGYSIRLCKSLHVKHLKCWRALSLLRAEILYRALPWTELLLRYRQTMNDLNLKVSARLSVVLVFVALFGVFASIWWPVGLAVGAIALLLLILLNLSVYQFFYQKRGLWFMLRVLPWHCLYFLYSGLAYGIGTVRFYVKKLLDSFNEMSFFRHIKQEKIAERLK